MIKRKGLWCHSETKCDDSELKFISFLFIFVTVCMYEQRKQMMYFWEPVNVYFCKSKESDVRFHHRLHCLLRQTKSSEAQSNIILFSIFRPINLHNKIHTILDETQST